MLVLIAACLTAGCVYLGSCAGQEAESPDRRTARQTAANLVQEGRFGEAADILLQLQREQSQDRRLLFDCVAALAWAGRYEEAAELSKEFVGMNPPMYALQAAAQAQRLTGDWGIALSLYDDGIVRYPDEADFVVGRILVLVDSGQYQRAHEELEQAIQRFGGLPALTEARQYWQEAQAVHSRHERHQAAVNAARAGDFDAAIAILEQLQGTVEDTVILHDLAAAYAWSGRSSQAVEMTARFPVEEAPVYVREALVPAFWDLGDEEMAERLLRLNLIDQPERLDWLTSLVRLLTNQGRWDEAGEMVRTLPEGEARHSLASIVVSAIRERAALLAQQEKYDQALDLLAGARELYPHPGLLHDAIAILSWAEMHKQAVQMSRSLSWEGLPRYVRSALAISLRETGELDRAEALYRSLLADEPEAATATGLALTLVRMNRLEEALATLEPYGLEEVPDFIEMALREQKSTRHAMAATAAHDGDLGRALAAMETLRQQYPDDPALVTDHQTWLSWAGRYQDAVDLAESGEVTPDTPMAREALAKAYRETGRLTEAFTLYSSILREQPDDTSVAEAVALILVEQGRLDEAQIIIDRFRYKGGLPESELALIRSRRDVASTAARAGRYDQAIDNLTDLHERYPGNQGVIHDLVSVMAWSERWEDAVRLGASMEISTAPDYALNALALSLRRLERLDAALGLYRSAASQYPDHQDIITGMAITLSDLGQPDQAEQALDDFARRHPGADLSLVDAARLYITPPPPYETPPRPDAPYRSEQDRLVQRARDGEVEPAAREMAVLLTKYPNDVYLLGDYLVLLNWLRENEAVTAQAHRLDLALVHDYVAEAVTMSFLIRGQQFPAWQFMAGVLQAQKNNPDMLLTAAAVAVRAGDWERVIEYLRMAEESRAPGIANRVAETKERLGLAPLFALGQLSIQEKIPASGSTEGIPGERWERLAVARADIPVLDEITEEGAWYLTPAARRRETVLAVAGKQTFWGEQAGVPRDLDPRLKNFLDALDTLMLLQSDPDCLESEPYRIRVGAARLKILYEMNRWCDAIAEYEAIRYAEEMIPDGALLAAAGSYLGARYPAQAKEVYAIVIARADGQTPPLPEDLFEAKKGMFWAYLENEELEHALTQAEINYREGVAPDGGEPLYRDNDYRKADVTVTRGLAHLYTGFFKEAEGILRDAVTGMPANAGALSALASVQAMRGLPRTANQSVHLAQIHEPDDIGLTVKEAGNYLGYQEWRQAHRLVQEVQPYSQWSAGVPRLERDWETHNLYELRVDVAWSRVVSGVDPGTAGAKDDPMVEFRLFSKPIAYDWRVFGGAATGGGDFAEGHSRQRLLLGGIELRKPWLTAVLEVRADDVNRTEVGLELSGAVTPDDHWRIPFSFQRISRDTPLRARHSGITANSMASGVGYTWNERRSLGVNVAFMDFSDGNRRYSAGGYINQRLWSWFNHYLDGQINTYLSHNSLDADRPYYNPKDDFELGGALTYGNLLWRCYERSLSHAITVGMGNYHQRYYGSGLVWNVGYSQSLSLSDRMAFAYGVGYGRRIYDGDPEKAINAYLSAVYRF